MHCRDMITPTFILSTGAQSSNRMDIIDFLLVKKNHLNDGTYLHNGQCPTNIQSPYRIVKLSVWVIINLKTCLKPNICGLLWRFSINSHIDWVSGHCWLISISESSLLPRGAGKKVMKFPTSIWVFEFFGGWAQTWRFPRLNSLSGLVTSQRKEIPRVSGGLGNEAGQGSNTDQMYE